MNDSRQTHGSAVRAGMTVRATHGFLIAQPKIGYCIERIDAGTRAKLDSETATLLSQAFVRTANGMSIRQVTTWLREHDIRGRRGKPISLATVQRMLTDPYYAGLIWCEGRWVEGVHEPLIGNKLFSAVQRQLSKRRYSGIGIDTR